MSASSDISEKYWSWTKPEITSLTKPFWDALLNHDLVIQKCKKCGEYQWYPKPNCAHCGSRDIEWVKISGKGQIYSYAKIEMVTGNSPLFNKEIPYYLALVELDEGPRIYGMMTECDPNEVKIDSAVEVVFKDLEKDFTIPMFKPVKKPDLRK